MLKMPVANRSAIAVLLGGLVFLAGAAAYVTSVHVGARERLAAFEPRFARLLGLGESAAALDTALAERKAYLSRRVYPPSQDVARAGSDALQRAREMFTKAGLTVSSTQVLPAKEAEGFDRIPLSFRVDGDLGALQSALVVLLSQSPALFVEGFNVQTMGSPQAALPQQLSVQVNLFVLRSRQ
jgi:general secretion pathway protein M